MVVVLVAVEEEEGGEEEEGWEGEEEREVTCGNVASLSLVMSQVPTVIERVLRSTNDFCKFSVSYSL